jgi:hypothetical protein
MDIPGHISESLENFLGLKILKLFDADADSGSGIRIRIRDKHPGSLILITIV